MTTNFTVAVLSGSWLSDLANDSDESCAYYSRSQWSSAAVSADNMFNFRINLTGGAHWGILLCCFENYCDLCAVITSNFLYSSRGNDWLLIFFWFIGVIQWIETTIIIIGAIVYVSWIFVFYLDDSLKKIWLCAYNITSLLVFWWRCWFSFM